jgi:hypothetical protein
MIADLSAYRRFVETDADLEALRQFSATWFTQGTSFESDVWYVSDGPGKNLKIDFGQILAPRNYLTDEENKDLLRSLKVSTFLVRSLPSKTLGGYGAESQYRHMLHVLNFFRFLFCIGISSAEFVNRGVFETFLEKVHLGVFIQLDVVHRLKQHLDSLSDEEVRSVYVVRRRRGGRPELAISKICEDMGVSHKVSSQSPEIAAIFQQYANDFGCQKTNFSIRHKSAERIKTRDSLRKELTAIQKFMAQTVRLPDLFPSSSRFTENFFSTLSIKPNIYAKKRGRVGERTRSIPQKQFFFLMDRAIRWVVDYSDALLDLSERYHRRNIELLEDYDDHYVSKLISRELGSEAPIEGPGAPGHFSGFSRNNSKRASAVLLTGPRLELARSMREKGKTYAEIGEHFGISKSSAHTTLTNYYGRPETAGISLGKAVYHFLPTACLVVLYAFSARRQHEIESLVAGSCRTGVRGPEIDFYVGKTYQEEHPFPATKLMHKAVGILERLSAPVRSVDDNRILQFPSFKTPNESNELSLTSYIHEFCEHIEIPNLEDDIRSWEFSEHQFRRLFALMYFYRYEDSDLSTLSWHLRHTDWEMTVKYVTDPKMRVELDSVMRERIYEMVTDSASGDCGGEMSKELGSLLTSLEGHSHSRVDKLISKKVDEIGYVIDVMPPGACFGRTPGYAERGNCFSYNRIYPESGCAEQCDGCPNLASFANALEEQEAILMQPFSSPMLAALTEGD